MQQDPRYFTFIEMIKVSTIKYSKQYNVLPSVIAALAAKISDWGTSIESSFGRNIFSMTVDDEWNDKCYSKDTEIIYNTPEECTEPGAILYKIYDTFNIGIEDFIKYITSVKRSEDGPLKYGTIIGEKNYSKAVDKLMRAGFMQHYMNMVDDVVFIQGLIAIIENFHLYEWDE